MAFLTDRRETLAALLASLAWAPAAGAQTAPVELALSETRARYFLPVRLNVLGEASFLLDTGSPAHVISESLAGRLGLRTVGRRRLRGYGGGGDSPLVRAEQFNVGGIELGPTALVVWPDAMLDGRDGFLGYPLLAQGARLALADRKLVVRTPWGATGTEVAAEVSRDGAVLIGGLPGAEGRFAFDTGAQELTISPAYHQRILTNPAYLGAPRIVVRDASGQPDLSRVISFRPEVLKFGALVCADPLVRIGQAGDGRDRVFEGVDGLLGVDFLRRYVWNIEPGRMTALEAEPVAFRAPAANATTQAPQGVTLVIPPQGGPSPIGGISFGAPQFEPAPAK